jgi:hypothetical protein
MSWPCSRKKRRSGSKPAASPAPAEGEKVVKPSAARESHGPPRQLTKAAGNGSAEKLPKKRVSSRSKYAGLCLSAQPPNPPLPSVRPIAHLSVRPCTCLSVSDSGSLLQPVYCNSWAEERHCTAFSNTSYEAFFSNNSFFERAWLSLWQVVQPLTA